MINVSQEYLDAVSAPIQRWRVKGYSVAFGGEFGEDAILKDSFSLSNRCADTTLKMGGVFIGELNLSMLIPQNENVDIIGASIDVSVGVNVSQTLTERYEEIEFKDFTIAEAKKTGNIIAITAYDKMSFFDAPYDDAIHITSGTAFEFLQTACATCGVELETSQQEINAMPNGNRTLNLSTKNDVSTWRDLISWIAITLGGFAVINHDAKLEVRSVCKPDADAIITPQERFKSFAVGEYIDFFGITTTNNKGKKKIYKRFDSSTQEEDAGHLLVDVGNNPFIQGSSSIEMWQSVANSLQYGQTVEFTMERYCGVEYQLGDKLHFAGGVAGLDGKDGYIHSIHWTTKGCTIQGFSGRYSPSKADKRADGLASELSDTEAQEVKYYVYINNREYNIGQGEDEQLIGLTYATVGGGYIIFQCEIHAECNGKIEFSYYINDVLMDWKPHDVYDGAKREHIISLMMPINTSANTVYDFELWAHCVDGSAKIKIRDLRAIIWGQGLASSDNWNGRIRVSDEFSRIQLGGIDVESYEEDVSLTTAIPIRVEVNESMSNVVPIQRVSIYNNMQETIYFNRRFAENYTWEEFELNTWQEAEDNFLWD